MNKVFKVIFNKSTGTFTAVSEFAKAEGKSSATVVDGSSSSRSYTYKIYSLVGAALGSTLLNIPLVVGTTMLPVPEAVAAVCTMNAGTATSVSPFSLACGVNASTGNIANAVALGRDAVAGSAGGVAVGHQSRSEAQSIAVGRGANASNQYSVVLGTDAAANVTGNSQGVAIGYKTIASGDQSMAIGANAISSGSSSIAIGGDDLDTASKFNITGQPSDTINGGSLNILFKNISGVDLVDMSNPATTQYIATQSAGQASVAVGVQANSSGHLSTAFGTSSLASGLASTALGVASEAGGRGALAAAPGSKATGETSIALGAIALANQTNAVAISEKANATGTNAIAIGQQSNAITTNATAIGSEAAARATDAIAIGTKTIATATATSAVALGHEAEAGGLKSVSVGYNATSSSQYGIAIGSESKSLNNSSVAVGELANASGVNAYALGKEAIASGLASYAIGEKASATNNKSIAIGSASQSSGDKSIAVGDGANATNTHSFAMGGSSLSTGTNALAIGSNTKATGNFAIAQGNAANASAEQAQAMGVEAVASANQAVAIGPKANATAANTFAAANNALASGAQAVAIGSNSKAIETNTIALGNGANASGANAMASGVNSKAAGSSAIASGNNANASGNEAIATGRNTVASGANSIATGYGAQATANQAIATGQNAIASGISSVALGQNAKAGATGLNGAPGLNNAIAIGTNANATAAASTIAIGQNSNVSSLHALALGTNATVGTGFDRSVALGAYSTVSGAVQTDSATVGDITYSGFKGDKPAVGDVVSVGSSDRKRQIQNVAAGQINADSTDAINGSQLYATNSVLSTLAKSVKTEFGGDAALNPNTGEITFSNIGNTGKGNIHDAIAAVKENVVEGSNVVVTPVTAANGSTTYTIHAKDTTASDAAASREFLTVTGQAPVNNVTNYETALTDRAIKALEKAETAVQNITSRDGSVKLSKEGDTTDLSVNRGASLTLNDSGQLEVSNTTLSQSNDMQFSVTGRVGTNDNKFVTAGNLKTYLNNAGFQLGGSATTGGTFEDSVGTATTDVEKKRIRTGEILTMTAGKGMNIKQVEHGYEFAVDSADVTYAGNKATVAENSGSKVATVQSVADAINNSGFTLKTSATTGGEKLASSGEEIINPADAVEMIAGKNLTVKQDTSGKITYATKDNVDFTSVTAGTTTTTNLTVKPSGNVDMGNNTINNVANGTLGADSKQAVNGSQLFATNNNVATNTQNIANNAQNIQTNADNIAKGINFGGTTGSNNYALGSTINVKGDSDITSETVAGGAQLSLSNTVKANLTSASTAVQSFTTAVKGATVDTITKGNTVINFVDGVGTTATIKENDITFDVNKADLTTDTAGKVTSNKTGDNFVTGDDVAEAINEAVKLTEKTTTVVAGKNTHVKSNVTNNNTEYTVSADKTTVSVSAALDMQTTPEKDQNTGAVTTNYAVDLSQTTKNEIKQGVDANTTVSTKGLTFTGDSGTTTEKKLGESVKVEGDNNIKTTASTDKVKVELNPDLSVNSVKATDNVTVGNGANPITINQNGIDMGNKPITNVDNGLTNYTGTNTQKDGLVNLAPSTVADNTVATVGDLRDMGWVVSSDKTTGSQGQTTDTAFSKQVKNANEVKFVGTGAAKVSGVEKDGANVITVHVDPAEAPQKSSIAANTSGQIGVKNGDDINTNPDDSDSFVTATDVVKAVNNSFWKVFEGSTSAAAGKKDDVKAGDNVVFANGTGTVVSLTSDGTTTTIKYDIDKGDIQVDQTTGAVTQKAGEGDNKVATTSDVVEAISKSGFKAKSGNTGTGTNSTEGDLKVNGELINPSDVMTFIAGDNLDVQHTKDGNFTFKTKQDVTFTNVTSNNVTATNVTTGGTSITNAGLKAGDVTVTNAPITVNNTPVNNVNEAINKTAEQAFKPLTFAGDSGTNVARQLGTTLNIKGGAANTAALSSGNIAVLANGNDTLDIKLAKELTDINSIAINDGPTINGDGIDMNDHKITDLKAGEADGDAVNVKQLKDSQTKVVKGTNVASVTPSTDDATGATTYTVNVNGATATHADSSKEFLKVSDAQAKDNNISNYEVSLTKRATDALEKAEAALQSFTTSVNGTTVDTIDKDNPNKVINFVDGTGTTAAIKNNDITFNVNKGGLTTDNAGNVTSTKVGDNFVTGEDVANAINNAGFIATASGNTEGTVENKLITTGDTVTLDAGKNLTVTQTGGKFSFATKDDVTFNNITTTNLTVNNGGTVDMGNNKVTNVAPADLSDTSTDAVNGSQLYATNQNVTNLTNNVNAGFNITADKKDTSITDKDNVKLGETITYTSESGNIVTTVKDNKIDFDLANKVTIGKTDGKPITVDGTTGKITGLESTLQAVTNQQNIANPYSETNAAPITTAATVGDVLNAGWNVKGNGTDKDFVQAYDTVDFVNGTGTTVELANTDGKTTTVKVNVNSTTITQNTTDGKAQAGDANNFATAGNVAEAINKVGLKFSGDVKDATAAENTFKRENQEEAKIVGGVTDTTKLTDNNIGVVSNGSDTLTVKLAKDINVNSVKATDNITIGDGAGSTKLTSTTDGLKVEKSDGTAQTITNVKAGTNATDAVNVSQLNEKLTNSAWNLKVAQDEAAATNVGDGKINGENTVTFTGKGAVKVSTKTTATETANYGVDIEVETAKVSTNTTTGKVGTGDNGAETAPNTTALVTAGDVINAVNSSFWKVGEGEGNAATKKDDVKAGDTVNFANGKNTLASVETSTNGETTTVKFEVDTTELTVSDGTKADTAGTTIPNGKVEVPTDANKIATAQSVANAINNSGFTLKTTATTDGEKDATSTADELINAGDVVDIEAGKNIKVKQAANGKITVATKDDVSFNNVTATNSLTLGSGTTATKLTPTDKGVNFSTNNQPTVLTGVTSGLTTPTNGLVNLGNNAVDNNTAATVGDLRNMGFVVSSDKTTGELGTAYNAQVKNANEVKFVGTGLATVSGKTDGNLRTITVDVNAQSTVETAQTPVVYTNANGDKLTKVGDNFYKTTDVENGQPKTGVTAVKPGDVIASMNAGNNKTDTPTTLANVKSNLSPVTVADGEQPSANNPDNLADKLNNAATVADVLNSGWNLQDNGTSVDTVTHNDAVNFVDGRATTVSVKPNDDGTVNDVQVDIETDDKTITVQDGKLAAVTTPITQGTDGKATTNGDTTSLVTGDQVANAINNSGLKFEGDKADAGATTNNFARNNQETAKVLGGAEGELSDKNIGVVSNGVDALTVKLAKDLKDLTSANFTNATGNTTVNGNGITITPTTGDQVSLTDKGLDNGNNQIKNVAAGTALTDAVNVSQLRTEVAASQEEVVSRDGSISVQSEVNPMTKATVFDVSVNVDNATITKDKDGQLTANTVNLTNDENGKVNAPTVGGQDAGKSLVTAQTVVDAINNSGFTLTTGQQESGLTASPDTKELINPGKEVKMIAGDNLVVAQEGGNIAYSLRPNINIESVQFNNGPKITNDGNNIKVSQADGSATKITNVADGDVNADSKDAVNGSQLHTAITNINNNITESTQTYFHTNNGTNIGGDATTNLGGVNQSAGATALGSLAAGIRAKATGENGVAVGSDSLSSLSSVAVGNKSKAEGRESVAIGLESSSSAWRTTAIGYQAEATVESANALGNQAKATNWGATAVGTIANASGINSSALGNNASSSGSLSLAVGTSANATGNYSTAVGTLSNAKAYGAIGTGLHSYASGQNAIATGSYSVADGIASIATGWEAVATGRLTTAVGYNAKADNNQAIAVGTNSVSPSSYAISIGSNTGGLAHGAVALGRDAIAGGDEKLKQKATDYFEKLDAYTAKERILATTSPTASSYNRHKTEAEALKAELDVLKAEYDAAVEAAFTKGEYATALGAYAQAEHKDSVALGSYSTTAEAVSTNNATVNGISYSGFAGNVATATVSVGKEGAYRTITNVAAGRISAASTDAINGSQLYAVANAIPATYTTTAGAPLVKVGDKFYKPADIPADGSAPDENKAVNPADVMVSLISPNASQIANAATTLANVKSNLAPVTPIDEKQPDANSAANLADKLNNAATVADVLNAGWNLQNNDTAIDTVTHNDAVNFINGRGTTVSVTANDDGTVNNIQVDSALGYVNTDANDTSTPSNTVKVFGQDNSPVQMTNVASGVRKADGTAPVGQELAEAIKNATGDILNNAVNVGDLKAAVNASKTEVVSYDESIKVTEEVGENGQTIYDLAVSVDDTTIETDGDGKLRVKTTELKPEENGKVAEPTAEDAPKLVNAGDIAKAINASGFNVKSGGNKAAGDDETSTLINPGEEVTFTAGDNLKVKRVGNEFSFETAKEVKFDSVQLGNNGPKLTNDGNNIKVGDKDGNATSITNVKSNLAPVTPADEKQPDANSAANLADKLNNAATVADVLNAGWSLQNNDTAIDTVTHNDAVNFINGRGTTVSVTANDDGTVNNIQVDSALGYVNTDANDTSTPSNTVKVFGKDDAPVQITNVASGVRKADGTAPVGQELAEAIKNATGDILNNAVNVGDLKAAVNTAIAASQEDVVSTDGSISVQRDVNPVTKATTFDVSVNVDNTTITKDKDGQLTANTVNLTNDETGKVNNPTVGGQDVGKSLVTAQTVTDAINNSGWNLAADGTGGKELVNPGETVTFKTGSDNLTVKRDGANITYDLAKDITVDSVKAGNTTVNNAGITIENAEPNKTVSLTNNGLNNGGNKITNVAAGEADDDAVNVSQLNKAISTAVAASQEDVISTDGSISVQREVNSVTKATTFDVSVNVDNTTITKDKDGQLTANTVNLTNDETGKVNNPTVGGQDVGKSLVTAQTVTDAINNSGFKAKANGDEGELINPGDEVEFINGSNIEITREGGKFTVATAKEVKFDSVQLGDNGPKLTNDGNNIKLGDKDGNATSITNVKSNLAPVTPIDEKQPDANSAANLADKLNNAATVADVLNAGWNLQNNDTAIDTVTHNDAVNFINGRGTTVSVTANDDGTVNNIQVDSALGYVNTDANDTSTPSNTVKVFGKDDAPVQITNVASGVRNEDGTAPTGKALAKAINEATGDTLNNAVNVGDLQAATKAATTKVEQGDNIVVTPTTNEDGSTTYNVATAKDLVVDSVKAGDTTVNNDGVKVGDISVTNAPITVDGNTVNNVNEAINQTAAQAFKPLTFAGDSGANVERRLGTTVNVKGGVTDSAKLSDNNIGVVANGTDTLEVKLAKDIKGIDSIAVNNGPTINGNGINMNGDKITNVGDGEISPNSQDAVNGAQLNNYTKVNGQNIGTDNGAINIVNGNGTTVTSDKAGELKVNVNSTDLTVADNGTINVQDPNSTGAHYVNATTVAQAVNNVSWNVNSATDSDTANAATKNTYTAGNNKVKAGDTVKVNAGRNVEISGSGKSINVAVSDNPEFNTVKVGKGKDATTISSDADGVRIAKADGSPQRITNVAAGRADNDAVNVGQLKGAVGDLNKKINRNQREARAGIAGAAAIAGLPEIHLAGKSMVATAASTYKGENAIAVGYSRLSDNSKIKLKITGSADTKGDFIGTVGVGYAW